MRQEDILVGPWISEKTAAEGERHHHVTFCVAKAASKGQIRDAVQKMFQVKVASVRTLITHGKLKRRGKDLGRRANRKKAIVTLKEGHNIDFYQAE